MNIENPFVIIGGLLVVVLVFGGIAWFVAGSKDQANLAQVIPAETAAPKVEENTNTTTNKIMNATIKTAKGDIVLELYPDAAPKTVENFIAKAKAGYFNGLKFHRVEDWVIQGGDPLSRDESQKERWGTGGGNIQTELSARPFVEGALGVARGPDIKVSNDSQFFIVKKDSQFLNNQYTFFGQTVAGMDVVRKIQPRDKILSIEIAE